MFNSCAVEMAPEFSALQKKKKDQRFKSAAKKFGSIHSRSPRGQTKYAQSAPGREVPGGPSCMRTTSSAAKAARRPRSAIAEKDQLRPAAGFRRRALHMFRTRASNSSENSVHAHLSLQFAPEICLNMCAHNFLYEDDFNCGGGRSARWRFRNRSPGGGFDTIMG